MDHNLDNHVRQGPVHQRQEIHPKTAKKSLTKSRNNSQVGQCYGGSVCLSVLVCLFTINL